MVGHDQEERERFQEAPIASESILGGDFMYSMTPLLLARMLFTASMLAWASGIATAGAPASGEVRVTIVNFAFVPQEITIDPGDAVTWINDDGSPHAIVVKDGSDGAKSLLPGETFVRVFLQPGRYEYFCSFHNFMTGRVIVRAP